MIRSTILKAIYFSAFMSCLCIAQNAPPQRLKTYLTAYVEKIGLDPSHVAYSFAFAHLSSSKEPEVIVRMTGSDWCGSGGCILLVLASNGDSYKKVSAMTITNPPVRVLDTQTSGWHDIGVFVRGGGILRGYEARMRYNGTKYPPNPSTSPKTAPKAAGEIVIPENAESISLVKP
ncbi:hypothetical protein Acid345_0797 [Candidatus Koribacter versatilis Ellin345]|uniref:Lipoprotein n=1 Tax=Koribacter versatilis (strain Ellin345) TaxID=204669 RepID=Q1ITJ8_KORVE|nr:hypothetical protein [Candidatus Koribacter versatilis]ABF39802.1 hypothetical protein Acid345_0797 [Candidatus Koribacter versatilis Ellin345]